MSQKSSLPQPTRSIGANFRQAHLGAARQSGLRASKSECRSNGAAGFDACMRGQAQGLADRRGDRGGVQVGAVYKTRTVLNCAGSGRCMLPASQAK
jgi:hypothetical protein